MTSGKYSRTVGRQQDGIKSHVAHLFRAEALEIDAPRTGSIALGITVRGKDTFQIAGSGKAYRSASRSQDPAAAYRRGLSTHEPSPRH